MGQSHSDLYTTTDIVSWSVLEAIAQLNWMIELLIACLLGFATEKSMQK